MDQFLERLIPLCGLFSFSSFLSYSIFWLIPVWDIEASCVYLFAQASKTHARGSPRGGHPPLFKQAPVALHRRFKSLVSGLYWLSI